MIGFTELNYSGKALTGPDPWLPAEAVITAARRETYDTVTYSFALRQPDTSAKYAFRPGQFNMVGILGIGEAAISLSSDPGIPGRFQHTVRSVGDVTGALARLQPGDVVGLRGPFGSSWPMEEARDKDIIIVAGGIGIAPLRPVIEAVLRERDSFGELVILYGARTPRDVLYTADFDRWSGQPATRLLLTVDRPENQDWNHSVGVVPVLFDQVSLDPARSIAMVCGPEVMIRFAVVDLLKRELPPEQVFVSLERRMRCGVAQCGHCFLGPKFVCQDGPVFRHTQLYGLFLKGV